MFIKKPVRLYFCVTHIRVSYRSFCWGGGGGLGVRRLPPCRGVWGNFSDFGQKTMDYNKAEIKEIFCGPFTPQ